MTHRNQLNYQDMQEQLRGDLTGSSVRLSEGKLEGRIHVEIEVDMLNAFFQKVEEQKAGIAWLLEKEQMEKEIRDLKAQLPPQKKATYLEALKGLKPTTNLDSEVGEMEKTEALMAQIKQEHAEKVKALRNQLGTLTEAQLDIQTRLEQKTSYNDDLRRELDRLKDLNEGLDASLQQEKAFKFQLLNSR